MNYFEFHLGDFAEATAHLSFIEDAAYCRLLRKIYSTERALPEKKSAIYRLVGADKKTEQRAVDTVLAEFFELTPDGWMNPRAAREIARFQDKQAKAKRSADTRWNAQRAQSEGNANASEKGMRTHSEGNALQTPVTSNQTPDPIPSSPTTAVPVAARPVGEQLPGLPEIEDPKPKTEPPPCPHLEVLALWAEVLPGLPQHDPEHWNPTRRKHLQTRWRETAAAKGWTSQADGLAFFRKLFAYVGKSQFLTGRSLSRDPNRPPFVIELEWLILPTNWAKVIEGKYHPEA